MSTWPIADEYIDIQHLEAVHRQNPGCVPTEVAELICRVETRIADVMAQAGFPAGFVEALVPEMAEHAVAEVFSSGGMIPVSGTDQQLSPAEQLGRTSSGDLRQWVDEVLWRRADG